MKTRSALVIGLVLMLAACSLPRPAATTLDQESIVNTAAAQTVVALSTEIAGRRTPTPEPTATLRPGETPPSPTPTHTPPPTNVIEDPDFTADANAPCLQAEFISDVTIADGTTLTPNSTFTKVWEVRNTGSCSWTSAYSVVFAGAGLSLGAADPLPLTNGEVKPGNRVQISIPMRAPADEGDYKGSWLLRSADGKDFGVGADGDGSIYVQIRVANEIFLSEWMCSAVWSTNHDVLPCPTENTGAGGITLLQNPILEEGTEASGLAMQAVAPPMPEGYIVGQFPALVVPPQADFRATLSCAKNAEGCYVRFKLTAMVDNGPEQSLGEWNEGLDGNVNSVAVDLDALAGQSAAFRLYVYVNGPPQASQGVWYNPRIVQQ